MIHPLLRFDFLDPDLGRPVSDRRRIRHAALKRATMSEQARRRTHPGGIVPPHRSRWLEATSQVLPWCLGLVTFLAFLAWGRRPLALAMVLVAEAAVIWVLTAWAARRAFRPWQWCILREEGADVCLACGAQGRGTPDPTAPCPECGALSPTGS